jgi:hypothetical protein
MWGNSFPKASGAYLSNGVPRREVAAVFHGATATGLRAYTAPEHAGYAMGASVAFLPDIGNNGFIGSTVVVVEDPDDPPPPPPEPELNWVNSSNTTITDLGDGWARITKSGGGSAYNGYAKTTEPFTGDFTFIMKLTGTAEILAGLNDNPTDSYLTMERGLDFAAGGNPVIPYTNGFTASGASIGPATTTEYWIMQRIGDSIKVYKNANEPEVSSAGAAVFEWTDSTLDYYGEVLLYAQNSSFDVKIEAIAAGIEFPATTDNTLPIPSLTLVSVNANGSAPVFDIGNLADASVPAGDVLWIEQRNKAGALIARFHNVLDDAEANAETASFGLSAITAGTYRYKVFLARGSAVSQSSEMVIAGPDDIEPVITLPTSANVQSTSATVGATTDTAEGTLYVVATLANEAPSALQIEAGQNAAGAATPSGFATITAVGANSASVSGLTAGTQYYTWLMHKDAAGNRSAVLNGADFSTSAAITPLGWDPTGLSSDLTLSNSDRTVTMTTAAGPRTATGLQARNSGKRWVEFDVEKVGVGEADPGLQDAAAGKIVKYASNSGAGDAGGGWNSLRSNPAKVRFELDFDEQEIQVFLDGVSQGTKAFPAGATSFKPWIELVSTVGSKGTINTGQAVPMGTVTPDFLPWAAP